MSAPEKPTLRSDEPVPDGEHPPYFERLGEEVLRLYRAAVAYKVPTVIETPEATIVITPKNS